MRNFHPVTVFVFFAAMLVPLMLTENPVYTAVMLVGAVLMLLMTRHNAAVGRELLGYAVIFLLMAALNPLFVHRGSTPLFFLNGRAVTLEAVVYGICSSLRLTAAIIWCRSFSIIMTSERIFCLMGKLSPKISAMLMMTMRFIPDLLAQARRISSYSRTSGDFPGDSLLSRFRRLMRVFSALVTWAIESAVQTADSMKSRGFELGGRTAYSRFEYMPEDFAAMLLSASACAAAVIFSGDISMEFYPTVNIPEEHAALAAVSSVTAAAFLFPVIFTAVLTLRRSRSIRSRRK